MFGLRRDSLSKSCVVGGAPIGVILKAGDCPVIVKVCVPVNKSVDVGPVSVGSPEGVLGCVPICPLPTFCPGCCGGDGCFIPLGNCPSCDWSDGGSPGPFGGVT